MSFVMTIFAAARYLNRLWRFYASWRRHGCSRIGALEMAWRVA